MRNSLLWRFVKFPDALVDGVVVYAGASAGFGKRKPVYEVTLKLSPQRSALHKVFDRL